MIHMEVRYCSFRFGAIIWHNLRMLLLLRHSPCNNLYICVIMSIQKRQLTLGCCAYSYQTIWTYNSLPLYVAARRLPTTDFPFQFPWLRGRVSSSTKVNCFINEASSNYTAKPLPVTYQTQWLDSDSMIVTVDNCQQHGDWVANGSVVTILPEVNNSD